MATHNVAGKEGLILWKIVDGDGNDEEINEGELFDSFDEAKEECDRLHDKYDIDTDGGWGNYQPWYVPQSVQPEGSLEAGRWVVVKYREQEAN